MPFQFSIQTAAGDKQFSIDPGTSVYFVGANGGGKTRLAVRIEEILGERCHRISAHRALTLNPDIPKVSEQRALRGLRYGYAEEQSAVHFRQGNRWGNRPTVALLNDYDFMLQALFADQANTSLITHKNARAGDNSTPKSTKFEQLTEIWDKILPHRKLNITGDDVLVEAPGGHGDYSGSQMSDGERAIFYLLGQTLTAPADTLIIFDEPELHIHRAVMSRLWDELEATRQDCALLMISHDLEFVASRSGQKYVLREFSPQSGWKIEEVPEQTGFSEEVATLILGSRRPILFVEGTEGSLDSAIYRACYPGWTVVPRASCEEVMHAVITMRANRSLTRVTCAGIVDADDYSEGDKQFLISKGIATLPVSEIENLFLLPNVLEAIAMTEGYTGGSLEELISRMLDELFTHATLPKNQLDSVMRYCRRRIDRALKKIDLSDVQDIAALEVIYLQKTSELNISSLAREINTSLAEAINNRDAVELLKWYDNKGLLAIAAKAKGTTKDKFEQWVVRAMRNGSAPVVTAAIRQILPSLTAA
ncbi:AAA family ATPase [Pseudoduganella sp. SL102]|uniref:AAA family ATPase n=1 Tax=Pseudoduganella sp. SL102 TaxID=2995154 RepID=UPI00248D300A|nr:AAA family ATPase [Pseudoduganella sp. SL102]WBS05262.1 AAA family ATPase [Pseudoduganella sp. SL102]